VIINISIFGFPAQEIGQRTSGLADTAVDHDTRDGIGGPVVEDQSVTDTRRQTCSWKTSSLMAPPKSPSDPRAVWRGQTAASPFPR
jgi:hypothetical protein